MCLPYPILLYLIARSCSNRLDFLKKKKYHHAVYNSGFLETRNNIDKSYDIMRATVA